MPLINTVLTAGQQARFDIGGAALSIVSTASGLADLTLLQNGSLLDQMGQVGTGFKWEQGKGGGYDAFLVTPNASEPISLFAGNGTVTQSIAAASASAPVAVIKYGASAAANVLVNNGVVTTLIAPAGNVNGMVLWNTYFAQDLNGSMQIKASAPTSITDPAADVLSFGSAAGIVTPNPIFVPPGKGLYLYSASNGNTQDATVLYTLL
jgi:hypothetical protein